MFISLRSIETLSLLEESKEWEVLKLTLPNKTSSPGAISLGHRAFVVFGGWHRVTIKKSVIIREAQDGEGYAAEEIEDMSQEDTFVSNGYSNRNAESKEIIVFGTNYVHKYHQNTKKISLVGSWVD